MTVINLSGDQLMAQKKKQHKMQWKIASMLPDASVMEKQPGVAGPVTGISNDVLIVGGGANFPNGMPWNGAKKVYQDEIYLFRKKNGKMLATISSQKLPQRIAYSASVSISDGLIYLGGENESGVSDHVVMLKHDGKSDMIHFTQLQPLPFPLTNLGATVIKNVIYVAGGENSIGVSNKFLSLDLSIPTAKWEKLPDIPEHVSHAVLASQSEEGRQAVYLIGGRAKGKNGISEIYDSTYEFDLNLRQWRRKKSLPYAVSAATGIAISGNYIMVCSGDRGEVFSKVELINAAIEKESDLKKKQVLIDRKISLLTTHPGFSKDVLLYDTATDGWETIGQLPVDAPVTTTLVAWDKDLILPSGEIKSGIRSPKILTGRIFITK